MGLKPRPRRRPRRLAGHRRPAQKHLPPTWRAWQAQNGSKRWYRRAPLAVEWGLEWVVYRLRSLALYLSLPAGPPPSSSAIFWVLETDQRAKERHYRAWDLINAAHGSTGDGGRKDALEDLNKDGVSLVAAPLEQAHLYGVDLKGAKLWGANLQGAHDLTQEQLETAHGNDQTVFSEAHPAGALV